MRTRVLCGVVVVLAAFGLPACTAPVDGITAVTLVDGHPTALFHPCADAAVDQVRVAEKVPVPDQAASGAVGPAWSVEDPDKAHPIRELRLLDVAPDGWTTTTDHAHALAAFTAGRTYVVSATTTKGITDVVIPVSFTLADLRALKKGEVWAAPTQPYGDEKAMTLDEFATNAARNC